MRSPRFSLVLVLLALSAPFGQAQSTSHLANVSSRLFSQTGQNAIVSEFSIRGVGSGSYYLRALGPSLTTITDRLQDPTLRLLDLSGATLDQNDNWMRSPDKVAIIATGIPPTNNRESAVIDSLPAGTYTSVLQGVHNGVGSAISEVYDLSSGTLELAAAGVRGVVSTGDNVIISGFIISGNNGFSLLIRALGPSLTTAGLRGALRDPFMELHNGNGDLIASNDNWRDTQEQEILATGLAPADDRESALVVGLVPGIFTTVVTGAGGTTGLSFLQYYSLEGAPVTALNPAPPLR